MLCLSRTLEDKQNNVAKAHLAKSRLGLDGIVFPLFYDLSCADIRFFEPMKSGGNSNDSNNIKSKETLDEERARLRQRYLEFTQDKNKKK